MSRLLKDIGLNLALNVVLTLLIGLAFGSVRVQPDGALLVLPTTVTGMSITGLIFGLIMGVLTTLLVVRAVNVAAGEEFSGDKFPRTNAKQTAILAAVVALIVMAFSAIVLPAIMRLFGWEHLNFLQFIAFLTVYSTTLSRIVAYLLTNYLRAQLTR